MPRWARRYNVRPLAAGVDYVLHSATKYLGGHNDLLAGVIVGIGRKAGTGAQAARHHGQHQLAAQHLSAGARAENLRAAHAAAQRKRPGRGPVSGRASADREGLLSRPGKRIPITKSPGARCAGSAGWSRFWYAMPIGRQTAAVVDAVRIPRIAPSLGGVESLIEQPLVMSYYKFTPEERRHYGIPDNMIRLSCGIENPEDLVADLAQALEPGTGGPARGHAGSIGPRWSEPNRHQSCNFAPEPSTSATNPNRPPARSCARSIWPPRSFSPAPATGAQFDYSRSGNPTRRAFEIDAGRSRVGLRRAGLCLGHGRHPLRDAALGQAAITSWPAATSMAERIACCTK